MSIDPLLVDTDRARLYNLTARQLEVLAHAAAGHTNVQISQQLFITVDVVKRHLRRAYERLGATDRASAVAQAYELGVFRTRGQRLELASPALRVA